MKLKFNWNIRVTVGLIIGLLTPALAVPLVIWLISLAENFYFIQLWDRFWGSSTIQSKFVSLACLPNLAWFYLFLNKERYDLARGVIIGCACYIPYVMYIVFG
jgi:hypothetical protein